MEENKKHIDLEENRFGLFISDESYELDIMYGRNYLESDVNFTIKLYRINLIETKSHPLYGQSKPENKKYFSPILINAMVNVKDSEQKQYGDDKAGLVREDTGDLILGVYLKELEEKNVEINRGDIIEYNFSGNKSRYYEVTNSHNIVDSTSQSIGGFISYWKKITATPIKSDVSILLGDAN